MSSMKVSIFCNYSQPLILSLDHSTDNNRILDDVLFCHKIQGLPDRIVQLFVVNHKDHACRHGNTAIITG